MYLGEMSFKSCVCSVPCLEMHSVQKPIEDSEESYTSSL